MAEKVVEVENEVRDDFEHGDNVVQNNGGTELQILKKLNEIYLTRINEVERVEGDLEDPLEQIKAVKLENEILKEWNQKYQETIQNLCAEMSEAESILGEKYEQLMKHVKSMEKIPPKYEKEQQELMKKIEAIKSGHCDDDVGDTKQLNGSPTNLAKRLEEYRDRAETLQDENKKLSKVIASIQEGDSLITSRTQRLEQENEELRARIAELESLSKRSSVNLLDKIDFNDINASDSGVAEVCSTETLLAPVSELYSSTSTLKDFQITPQNEEIWNAFLKKVETTLKIDVEKQVTKHEDPGFQVEKLWHLIESRMNKTSSETTDAEIQVDVQNQLGSSVQNLSEIESNVVVLLETIDKHNTGLPITDIKSLLSDFDQFLASVKTSADTKIKTKFHKNGDVETTGFIDIPESKFLELLEKFKTHEKSINSKITQANASDMHQFRRQITSLIVQTERLRDQIQDKNYYQKENKLLQKKIETLEKKIQTLNGTIQKTFNSLLSSDLLEDKKRTELQQAFKMNDMIGLTLAIQSIGVGMRNEIFAASVESEKSREELRMLQKKMEAKEKEKEDIIKNTESTRTEMDEMKKMMNTLKMTEEESRQMKKYLKSVRVELIHLLESRNQHSMDTTDSSGGGSSITSDFETMSLSGLMNDLKREIITKEEVLKSRQIIIDNLELCLTEMKRHLNRLEQENHALIKANTEMNKKISVVEKEKQEAEEKKEEFDKLMTENQQELATLKQEKQQLECEHANQSQTISHLRRVLEETKRSGNATIKHSKDLNNILNLNMKTLMAQMDELYTENMEKERQIQFLRDGNLELREQITELNKDILEYKELLELKNLGSQFTWQKEHERESIKQYTNQLNEEIRKLREAVNTVFCVEKEKKNLQLEKYRRVMGEYENAGEASATKISNSQSLQRRTSHNEEFEDAVDQVKQILALSQDMAQANFDSKRYEELKDDMAALQARLQEFGDKNNQLCAMLTNYESKYKDFETQIGKLSHENNDLLHQIDDLTQNLMQLKRENAKLSENNIKVNTEFDLFRKACKCSKQSSSSRPGSPPNRHLSLQIKDLRKQLSEKIEENEKLKDIVRRNKSETQIKLKQTIADKERYHKECTELVAVVGEYKSRVAILDMNLQRKDSELVNALEIKKLAVLKRQEIEKAAGEMEKRYSDLLMRQESQKLQMEELREELGQVREEHRDREGRTLEELQAARQAIRDQQIRITQQEVNFKLILETRRQLEQRAEGYLKEIKQLKTKLTEECNTKAALMELTDVMESELKSLKDKLCRLTNADQDLGKAMSALESLKQHNYDLTIMHSELQRDYNLLRENHQKLLDLRTQSIKALETSQHVQEEGEFKELSLRSKIEELLGIISILVKDRDYLKSIVNEKHRDITILSSELSSINLMSQPSTIDYATKMHQPFFPSQLHEIPAGYTAETPTTVAVEPDAEAKLSGLRQLASTMQQMSDAWTTGLQTAVNEAS